MSDGTTYIYGKHALAEALETMPTAVLEVFLDPACDDKALVAQIRASGIKTRPFTNSNKPPALDSSIVHQGVVALVSLDRMILSYEDFIKKLSVNSDTALVILGEIQDPQNVGAVIRSAAAFGISGILIPERNQAQVNGTVVKVSAGMAFRVPLVRIGNINTVVRDLKERGFWTYGLAGEAKHTITKEQFDAPTLFILGNESEGIREKTKELCDKLLKIPMHPRCESLNAAASASVAFYAWSTGHSSALRNL